MTNKWTVNGVEAPEGAEFYANDMFQKDGFCFREGRWMKTGATKAGLMHACEDYQPRPKPKSALSVVDFTAKIGNEQHVNDYAFRLSEAINKLKHCADVAPDDKRKDALLEIVDEVEFIKSEGDK